MKKELIQESKTVNYHFPDVRKMIANKKRTIKKSLQVGK